MDAAAVHALLEQSNDSPNEADQEADPTFKSWRNYPQNLFPNWLPAQVKRCRMKESESSICTIYALDVNKEEGLFREVLDGEDARRVHDDDANDFWELIIKPVR